MIKLAYKLIDKIEIDDKVYDLDMSFDNVLRFIDMTKDKEIDDNTKVDTGLLMLINDDLPDYKQEDKLSIFIDLHNAIFKDSEETEILVDIVGNEMPTLNKKDEAVYSLAQDASYIYASFYQDYQIDLHEEHGKLHWEKFKSLLGGLRKDTRFKEVIEIRQMEVPKGKGSEKQAEEVKKMKRQYALKKE